MVIISGENISCHCGYPSIYLNIREELLITKEGCVMDQTLKLGKWGNSNAIRLPKALLDKVGIAPSDKEVEVTVTSESLVIKPKKEKSHLEQMFNGYDTSQPYPFEIVDKGKPVGNELI